jgi:hypothetical protein
MQQRHDLFKDFLGVEFRVTDLGDHDDLRAELVKKIRKQLEPDAA